MNKQQQAKARRQKSRRKRSACKRRGTVCGQKTNSVRTEISGHACENKIAQARNFPHPCNGKCGERTAVFPTCKPGLFWTDYKKINALE